MKTAKPSKADYECAKRVLRYLKPKADQLAAHTDQERPREWADGIWSVLRLLAENKDPEKTLSDYRAEYDAGH